jgi:adenylate cyclase
MNSPLLVWKHAWVSFPLAVLVCLIAAAAQQSAIFSDIEYWAYDFLCNHSHHHMQPENIVVVDFDDGTVAGIKRYPIPRSTVARVIRTIAAGNPRVIGLDLFLSEQRTPGEDQQLREALTSAGNVIVASQLAGGGLPVATPLPYFCEPPAVDSDPWYCKEGSPGALGHAFVNLPVDSDGFIRRMYLFSVGPHPLISFPLFLAQLYKGDALRPLDHSRAQFAGHRIPYAETENDSVLIGSWAVAPAPSISALLVITGQLDVAKEFGGKLVLIGQGSDAARDRHFTPMFRPRRTGNWRALLSGTQIHAAAIETLLSGSAISVLPPQLLWAFSFLLVFFLVRLLLRLPLRYGILAVFVGMAATYACTQVLFTWGHWWMRFVSVELSALIAIPASTTYKFVQERFLSSRMAAEREQIMGLFSRYVSPEVAQQIWQRRSELVLAGEERIATVLFSDIRGFTAITAGQPSAGVLAWLNEYLTAMDEVITEGGGFLNKFIGDGIMVLFGVPLSDGPEKDACRALRTALRMLERVDALNQTHCGDPGKPSLRIGIGIHTGPLTSGNVGSPNRLEYSVIGETVNLASRLESLTKEFHTEIVMSSDTAEVVRSQFPNLRDLGEGPVRGFEKQIHLYTIDRPKPSPSAASAAGEVQ